MGMSKKREYDLIESKLKANKGKRGITETLAVLPESMNGMSAAVASVERQKAIEKSKAERMKKAKKARALAKRKEEQDRVMNSSDKEFEKENPQMRGL